MQRDALVGAEVDLSPWRDLPLRALLFGEAQARIVVSTPEPAAVLAIARRHGVSARRIGTVRAAAPTLTIRVGERIIDAPLARLARAYHDAIPATMTRAATAVAITETTTVPV